jgi:hypothetical protein
MPVILIPVTFDVDTVDPNYPGRQHSVVLRPFISNDFMTGIAALPGTHIPEEVGSEKSSFKFRRLHSFLCFFLSLGHFENGRANFQGRRRLTRSLRPDLQTTGNDGMGMSRRQFNCFFCRIRALMGNFRGEYFRLFSGKSRI